MVAGCDLGGVDGVAVDWTTSISGWLDRATMAPTETMMPRASTIPTTTMGQRRRRSMATSCGGVLSESGGWDTRAHRAVEAVTRGPPGSGTVNATGPTRWQGLSGVSSGYDDQCRLLMSVKRDCSSDRFFLALRVRPLARACAIASAFAWMESARAAFGAEEGFTEVLGKAVRYAVFVVCRACCIGSHSFRRCQ